MGSSSTFQFLAALGYEYHRKIQKLSDADNREIPILSHVVDADGRDIVWIVEAPTPPKDDLNVDPLGMCFEKSQFESDDLEYAELNRTIEEILAEGVFGSENAPRNVLILGLSQLVLVDRNKWPNRSVLRFDLHEIFSANDPDTLKAMACFVSHEARAPKSGVPLADRLEEEAQRHANAVTSSLKESRS